MFTYRLRSIKWFAFNFLTAVLLKLSREELIGKRLLVKKSRSLEKRKKIGKFKTKKVKKEYISKNSWNARFVEKKIYVK